MDDAVGSNGSSAMGAEAPSTLWWNKWQLCYREPRVHDYELYFLLGRINMFAMLPICLIGMLVNATALVCLYRPPKITSGVFVYLKALLTLDMAQLLVVTLAHILPQICDYHFQDGHTLYQSCYIFRRFIDAPLPRVMMTVNTMHSWTIAAMSAHRYWKISRPVVSRFNDTIKRARCVLLVLVAGAIIFRLPLFIVELRFANGGSKGLSIYKVPSSTIRLSWYRVVYHSILDPLLAHVTPMLTMCVFSLLTLMEICHSREFGYHNLKAEGVISGKNGRAVAQNGTMLTTNGTAETAPLSACFKRRRSNGARQKQELRATVSIILIVVLYVALHAMELFYNTLRKWNLLISGACQVRADFLFFHISVLLCMISASINAFVFIAFTNRLKNYLEMLIRKTSRNLSSSSDPAHSPRVTMLEPTCLFEMEDGRKYNDTPL